MTALTWSSLEHSWSLLIVGVTRLHGLRRLCLSMMKVAALGPEPKRQQLGGWAEKGASEDFEAVEGIDLHILVCCKEDVVDV